MTQIFFSIIIPVYNTADYISGCLDSILDQNFDQSKYELILVDDGSTDHSHKVLTDYSRKTKNVTLIRKENEGVSIARNVGLQNAKGRNILFVDSDDYLEGNSLALLYNYLVSNDVEMLIGRSFTTSNGQATIERYPFSDSPLHTNFSGIDLLVKNGYFRASVCGVVFNFDFLKKYGLGFFEDLKNGEDTLFMINCSLHARKVQYINIPIYLINERIRSASRFWDFERVFLLTNNLKKIKELDSSGVWSEDQLALLDFGRYSIITNIYAHFYRCFSIGNYLKIRKTILDLNIRKLNTGKIKISKSRIKIYNFSLDLFSIAVLAKQLFNKVRN